MYDIVETIGVGSVGEVMCAIDRASGLKVAIKKLQTRRRGKDRLPFILREIEIISSSQHPNVVRYVDSYYLGDELWVSPMSHNKRY
jgi:serine/threonine protein kinase